MKIGQTGLSSVEQPVQTTKTQGVLGDRTVETGTGATQRSTKSSAWMNVKMFFAKIFGSKAMNVSAPKKGDKTPEGSVQQCLSDLSKRNVDSSSLLKDLLQMHYKIAPEDSYGMDDRFTSKQDKIKESTKNLSDMQLWRLYKNLDSDKVLDLQAGLGLVLGTQGRYSDGALNARSHVGGLYEEINLLKSTVKDQLKERGFDVQTKEPKDINSLNEITSSNKTAILGLINHLTPLYTGIKRGDCSEGFMTTFRENFFAPLTDTQTKEHTVDSGGVCEQFYADFTRHPDRFQILKDGEVVPLSTPDDMSEKELDERLSKFLSNSKVDVEKSKTDFKNMLKQEKTEEAAGKLLEFCGNSKELMFKVSQYMNQSSLGGLKLGYYTEHNPIILPNGVSGEPIPAFGQEQTNYLLEQKSDGSIGMRIKWSAHVEGIQDRQTGELTKLDPQFSVCIVTINITIDKEGTVTIDKPLNYEYSLKMAEDQ